jgi:hypothetical protein
MAIPEPRDPGGHGEDTEGLDAAERAVLEALERDLADGDPVLAHQMRHGWGRRRTARLVGVVLAIALVVGLLWLGLPGQACLVVVVTVALLLLTGWRPGDRPFEWMSRRPPPRA